MVLLEARDLTDAFAHVAAARKADFADLGIGTDRVANDAARAGDALNRFGRQASLEENLG